MSYDELTAVYEAGINDHFSPAPLGTLEDCSYTIFYPMVHGALILQQPIAAFLDGNVADVPFLSGTNQDESAAFGTPGGCDTSI